MVTILIVAVVIEAVLLAAVVGWAVSLKSRLELYGRACQGEEFAGEAASSVRDESRRMAIAKKLVDQQIELEQLKAQLATAGGEANMLRDELKKEQERSAQLLSNILPPNAVDELKRTGKNEPKSFNEVTVFFSDIVDFTRKTSFMDTNVVIQELNKIFTEFDRIFKKHDCVRIKTSGDAYLAVAGMNNAAGPHAANMLRAALEAMAYVHKLEKDNQYHWQMRMGIHTGRVSGGIVGSDKYIYDVFGDTINVAARMEQSSEPMQINVSEATYGLTRDEFAFVARGQIETKGKGLVNMYFLKDDRHNGAAPPEEVTRW